MFVRFQPLSGDLGRRLYRRLTPHFGVTFLGGVLIMFVIRTRIGVVSGDRSESARLSRPGRFGSGPGAVTPVARRPSGGVKGRGGRFASRPSAAWAGRVAWCESAVAGVPEGVGAGARRARCPRPRGSRAACLVRAPRAAPSRVSVRARRGGQRAVGRVCLLGLGGPVSAQWRRRSRHEVRSARPRRCL